MMTVSHFSHGAVSCELACARCTKPLDPMRRQAERRVGAICAHVCAATESVQAPNSEVEDEEARQTRLHLRYCHEGTQRALRLKNRGPMRLGPDKKLHPEILGARLAS